MSRFNALARPEAQIEDWIEETPGLAGFTEEERERVEIRAKYRGYLTREQERIRRFRGMEDRPIPEAIDFTVIRGISTEGRQKLSRVRPSTIGQASRISGVSPSDISVLLVELRRRTG